MSGDQSWHLPLRQGFPAGRFRLFHWAVHRDTSKKRNILVSSTNGHTYCLPCLKTQMRNSRNYTTYHAHSMSWWKTLQLNCTLGLFLLLLLLFLSGQKPLLSSLQVAYGCLQELCRLGIHCLGFVENWCGFDHITFKRKKEKLWIVLHQVERKK